MNQTKPTHIMHESSEKLSVSTVSIAYNISNVINGDEFFVNQTLEKYKSTQIDNLNESSNRTLDDGLSITNLSEVSDFEESQHGYYLRKTREVFNDPFSIVLVVVTAIIILVLLVVISVIFKCLKRYVTTR